MKKLSTVCFAFMATLAVLATAPAHAKRVALVIGNDDYDAVSDLEKAVNDARAIAKTLGGIGYEVFRAENVTRREMNRQLQLFVSMLRAGDEALFYFAGHGVAIDGRNYLLPTDIPNAEPGQEGFVVTEAIAVDQVLGRITSRGARVSVLVLDACRDNPFLRSGTRSLGGTRGLARMPAPAGTFIMYSAGEGQAALDRLSDDDPNPNSVFTRSLLPLLSKPGLSLVETARQLRRDVEKLATTVSHEQRPAYYDEVSGDFFFAGSGEQEEQPIVVSPDSDAAQAWAAIQNSNRMGDFETFIEVFPESFFARLAASRIQELSEEVEVAVGVFPEETETEELQETAAHACDRLAAHPGDPDAVTEGVSRWFIDLEAAEVACRDAVAAFPATPRFVYQLGRILSYQRKFGEARAAYEMAAKAGYAAAMLAFADSALKARGGPRDMDVFEYWLTEAASQRLLGAVSELAEVYATEFYGMKDSLKASEWYRRLVELAEPGVERGDVDAILALADVHEYGRGDFREDKARARVLYERAVDRDNAQIFIRLAGLNRALGNNEGAATHFGRAASIMGRQASTGDVDAIHGLGTLHERGQGVTKSISRSRDFYLEAAENGHEGALFSLALSFGFIDPKDPARALEWHARSALDSGCRNSSSVWVPQRLHPATPELSTERGVVMCLLAYFEQRAGNVSDFFFGLMGRYPAAVRRELQIVLRELGVYGSAIDGDLGPGSRAALDAFARLPKDRTQSLFSF